MNKSCRLFQTNFYYRNLTKYNKSEFLEYLMRIIIIIIIIIIDIISLFRLELYLILFFLKDIYQ